MSSNKILFAGLGVAVAVTAVYFFFLRNDEAIGPALSTGSDTDIALSAGAQAGREFLRLLQELDSIKLEPDILADPSFMSLQDFRVEPAPQPVGRQNPFAPAGARREPK